MMLVSIAEEQSYSMCALVDDHWEIDYYTTVFFLYSHKQYFTCFLSNNDPNTTFCIVRMFVGVFTPAAIQDNCNSWVTLKENILAIAFLTPPDQLISECCPLSTNSLY